MSTFKFELGERVKDAATGFTGVVTCRSEYLNFTQKWYSVQPEVGDSGLLPEAELFVEDRLSLVD